MPLEAPALRDTPTDRVANAGRWIRRAGVILEEAHDVARAGETDTDHPRISRVIHDVVDPTWLEAAIKRDVGAVHPMPFVARDHRALAGGVVAHGHDVLFVLTIQGCVGLMGAIGHGLDAVARVRDEV